MIRGTTNKSEPSAEPQIGGWHAGEKNSGSHAHESYGIAELVWKYFEDEIREALAEAQQHLGDEAVKVESTPMRRRKKGI